MPNHKSISLVPGSQFLNLNVFVITWESACHSYRDWRPEMADGCESTKVVCRSRLCHVKLL